MNVPKERPLPRGVVPGALVSPFRLRPPRPAPEPERVDFDDDYAAMLRARAERGMRRRAAVRATLWTFAAVFGIAAVTALGVWSIAHDNAERTACAKKGGAIVRGGVCAQVIP